MKEEGLIYDAKSGRFFHLYRGNGDLLIDSQPCQHGHSVTAVTAG